MRNYFTVALEKHSSYIFDPHLLKSVKAFTEKHWWVNELRINHFLEPPTHLRCIYAYSEDNCLYEFFSGLEIGSVPLNVVYPDNAWSTGSAISVENGYYGNMRANPCSMEYFVREVNPLMRHKKAISNVMLQYFELHRQVRTPNLELQRKMLKTFADEEKKKISEVEQFLNQRK